MMESICIFLGSSPGAAPVYALLENAQEQGFLKAPHRGVILRADTPADMIHCLKTSLER